MRYFYGFFFALAFVLASGISEAKTERFTGKITCVDQVEEFGFGATVRTVLWRKGRKKAEEIIVDLNRDLLKSAGIKVEVGRIFRYTITKYRKPSPGLQIFLSPVKPKTATRSQIERMKRKLERDLPNDAGF